VIDLPAYRRRRLTRPQRRTVESDAQCQYHAQLTGDFQNALIDPGFPELAPRDAKPDQNGLGSLVVRPRSEAGKSAACTVHAAGRLKASAMGIIGTAPEQKRQSSFGNS
jgi:hypothetical protein